MAEDWLKEIHPACLNLRTPENAVSLISSQLGLDSIAHGDRDQKSIVLNAGRARR